MDLEWALVTFPSTIEAFSTRTLLPRAYASPFWGVYNRGTLRQTHPIQRARSNAALKNSKHSNGVNLLSFLSCQAKAQSWELIKFKGKACREFCYSAFSIVIDNCWNIFQRLWLLQLPYVAIVMCKASIFAAKASQSHCLTSNMSLFEKMVCRSVIESEQEK